MKKWITALLVGAALGAAALPSLAQAPREDAIWARAAQADITLDGVLNEADWAQAESWTIEYAQDSGVPGSGFKTEAGWNPPGNPTYATLKFLVRGNQLYMGAVVLDNSVGGSASFNRFDGFLMGLKDHANAYTPKPVLEYMYTWWHDERLDPQPTGQLPGFIGAFAELPHGSPRTPAQVDAWDAVTTVQGLSNSDTAPDTGYTVEMRFNLTPIGYDVTQPAGDVVEFNISVYDTDGFWPISPVTFSSNRVWWQGPWGNDVWYNEVRILARPDVTTTSGAAPAIAPDFIVQEIDAVPTMDGALNEAVWTSPDLYSFDIRWDDALVREAYDGVGPFRAGQFQTTVNGVVARVLDPADATVKMYHRGSKLYLGFDVRDALVQYHPLLSRWDGAVVTINDRVLRGPDNTLLGMRLSYQIAANGTALAQDDLLSMVTAGTATVAAHMNAGTTVDTLGAQMDNGYTVEMEIDLTAMGYPTNLGDGALFIGVNLLDGDSFAVATNSYGTRTWWQREWQGTCCPAAAYLEQSFISGVGNESWNPYGSYAQLLGSLNPSPRPEVAFAMPDRSVVTLEVYDVRGRLVERRELGSLSEGDASVPLFSKQDPAAGTYLYRLQFVDPATGRVRGSLTGKTMLMK
jgi:hypothetical protein